MKITTWSKRKRGSMRTTKKLILSRPRGKLNAITDKCASLNDGVFCTGSFSNEEPFGFLKPQTDTPENQNV